MAEGNRTSHPPHLAAHYKFIIGCLAKYETPAQIVAQLAQKGVEATEDDIRRYTSTSSVIAIRNARQKIVDTLPISDDIWCMLKLNEIAGALDASPANVLSAIRTRNALMEGVKDRRISPQWDE